MNHYILSIVLNKKLISLCIFVSTVQCRFFRRGRGCIPALILDCSGFFPGYCTVFPSQKATLQIPIRCRFNKFDYIHNFEGGKCKNSKKNSKNISKIINKNKKSSDDAVTLKTSAFKSPSGGRLNFKLSKSTLRKLSGCKY